MKLWFVEARPNVFVSGIKDSVADTVVNHLLAYCPDSSGLIIFKKCREAPGYKIYGMGTPQKKLTLISGLQLVVEKELAQEDAVPDAAAI